MNPVGVNLRVETFPSAVIAKFAITRGRPSVCSRLILDGFLNGVNFLLDLLEVQSASRTIDQINCSANKAPEDDHENP